VHNSWIKYLALTELRNVTTPYRSSITFSNTIVLRLLDLDRLYLHGAFIGHPCINANFGMGFFRRAKAKEKLAVDQAIDDCEQDVVPRRRTSSHRQNIERHRRPDVRDDLVYEARIVELPPEPEMREVDKGENSSVGESLASEDHFDLCVPIKNEKPRKGILRNRSGHGLILLPNGRSFSRQLSISDSVSSVSYDSMLFEGNLDEHIEHRESQKVTKRSIKSRQSTQSTVKQNNFQKPSTDPTINTKKTPGAANKQYSFPTFCCCGDNTHNDGRQLMSTSNSESARGVKTRSVGDESTMSSTIPMYFTEYDVEHLVDDPTNTNKKTHLGPLPLSFRKKSDSPFFLNLCGPRQLPPEDLVADNETKPYSSPSTYQTYEVPLQFEKKDRSLFDPYSYDDEEAQHKKRLEMTKYYDDDQCTIPTYMDEAQTTMAFMESSDIPVHAEVRHDDYRYKEEDVFYYNHENHDIGEYDGSNKWRVRLPRNLPKVRNLASMTSLTRLRSFRSSNRSHRSGRSGRSRNHRNNGESLRDEHEHPTYSRPRSRSHGRSRGGRAMSNFKDKNSLRKNIVSVDEVEDKGRVTTEKS
jgi:hypothetical protein